MIYESFGSSVLSDHRCLQPNKSWTLGSRSLVCRSRCRGALSVKAFTTEAEPSMYSVQSTYASLPPQNRSNLVTQNRVLAGVRRRVPPPALVMADAATRFSIRAEVESGLNKRVHVHDELEEQVVMEGCSRIRLQCGAMLLLPPGITHCSPSAYAAVRMGITKRVSSIVKPSPFSAGDSTPHMTTSLARANASEAMCSNTKVMARPATVKVKAISRRVSLAAALAEV
ncbi:hypothetical protein CEUSTIGMA_g7668.t1 [Chlamydomonas eustigma]|uniref:Uncharacterized protein n=1 Tax=Chlamydomonas eustigma TaxID=1157962 RepID=A0A250XBT8_9CHLO|nr:hypothetical protein CEUSTIGMA_g7668.t1 [Chlamydomonas eustigma]|eukprot:GAX80230.1 hypothetical protein CEUSTIGMA_g7668.t1 [Chlamydomonas eustigma]